ncbi:hypothetical protein QU600_001030 [Orientia tsutsugamushi]|nr:transposase [Orientia tsutsugamushi]
MCHNKRISSNRVFNRISNSIDFWKTVLTIKAREKNYN